MQYIVIEGNIASGKTSLAKLLAEQVNASLILEEFQDNPFLPKFYEDANRYAFPLELSFLADRYQQVKRELLNPSLFHSYIIADYYFPKTSIFAKHTLKEDEYSLFKKIYEIIMLSVPKPSLYIYLHTSTNRLLENIKKRKRDFEQNMTAEYLERVHTEYMKYIKQIVDFPIVVIDNSQIDFINNQEDYRKLSNIILNTNFPNGINYIEV